MSDAAGFDSTEQGPLAPYVTVRKTRDCYCWSVCVAATDSSREGLKTAADRALEIDSYIRADLEAKGAKVDHEPARRRA